MNKKKKRTLYILVLFIFIITLVFGISYAIFSYYRNGAVVNQFYTADILYKVTELENFELINVFPENFEYGSTQEDNIVSFSLNGNIQTGVLDYTISIMRGDDISGKERLPEDALLVSISSRDESTAFVTEDFNHESLTSSKLSSKPLTGLNSTNSINLANGYLTAVSSIEHETFYVRIWVNDEKVMISDTICRNDTTRIAQNCSTTYVDDEGDTIQTYPHENAYTNGMYIYRTNELENMYYTIKVKVDSNL